MSERRKKPTIVHLREPEGPPLPSAMKCPACRLARHPGFMLARVGALKMPIEDAPAQISWPLACSFCGYEDEFGLVANPLPAPATPTVTGAKL